MVDVDALERAARLRASLVPVSRVPVPEVRVDLLGPQPPRVLQEMIRSGFARGLSVRRVERLLRTIRVAR